MRVKSISEIIEKYPRIFQDYEGNPWRVNWHCPLGWLDTLDILCGSIQNYIDNVHIYISNPAFIEGSIWKKDDITTHRSIPRPNHQVTCSQVKEKFGGLRFYINGGDDGIYGMIKMAEYMCDHTCQDCGSTEDVGVTMHGWVTTLCKKCYIESGSTSGFKSNLGEFIDYDPKEEEEEEEF